MLKIIVALSLSASFGAEAQTLFIKDDPSFTAAQAVHGKAVFEDNCAVCHGADLGGGQFAGPLKGPVFKEHWSAKPSKDLLGFIANRMPPSTPGSLVDTSYAEIEAYLLQTNGVAPGDHELPILVSDPDNVMRPLNDDAVYEASRARGKAVLDAMTPVSDAMLVNPPDADWLSWSRDGRSLAFSPLKQINRGSVGKLASAWSLSLPPSLNEIAPVVHDGVMFIGVGGNQVLALNAVTGELLWRYQRPMKPGTYILLATRMKAVALYEDKVYAPTADGHIVALDAKTGKLVWDQIVVLPDHAGHVGEKRTAAQRLNGAPLIAHGKVIVGASSGHDAHGGAFIVGLDARTGQEVWRFHTVARPDEPGGDSWNGADVDHRFGGGVWTIGSYDSKRNLVFFGTGNTYDTATLLLPQDQTGASNDALYTESTVALDPDTGKLVWHYQHMNRDVWDMDWAFEQSLITLPVKGKPTDIVLTGGKLAIFDAMDRETGKYLFSHDLGLQTLVTAIDPVTGHKTTDPKMQPEDGKAKFMCPHSNGIRNWMTTAYDPATSILYIPILDACGDYRWTQRNPTEIANGGIDIASALLPRLNSDGNFGQIEAINLLTGKPVWKIRQRAPIESSLLATAGGVVFSGSYDRLFHAYDSATGKLLWQTVLNLSPNASPVTYSVNGQQYVAIVAGGGGPLDSGAETLAQEIFSPPGAATVWVYRLP